MKYRIGKDGRVDVGGFHVILDEEQNLGVWVQPGAITRVQRLQDQWQELAMNSKKAIAAKLGKPVEDLEDKDLEGFDIKYTCDFVEALSSVVKSCFIRWDEGLVEFDGVGPVAADHKISDGVTAQDLWIDHLCEHDVPTAFRILGAATGRVRALEGNSQGPSAGTGATDEAQQAAAAPESTATAVPSIEDPEHQKPSAGIAAVPASPA